VEHKLNAPECVHALDDYFLCGSIRLFVLSYNSEKIIHMSEDIVIPINVDKTVYPTTTLTFLGHEIDTFTMELRKTDKIKRIVDIF
jgi:hypothetical protein